MKKIILFDLHLLHNEEHFQFHFDVKKLFEAYTPEKLSIGSLYPVYESAFEEEVNVLQLERSSDINKNITESDAFRNQLYQGFVWLQEAHTLHADHAVQESARRIGSVLEKYGDVRTLNYSQESTAISNLIQELKNNYSAELYAIGGKQWLASLAEANDEFITQFGNDSTEDADRVSGIMRNAREIIDPLYAAFIAQINALTIITGEANYAEFIYQLNNYINHYKTLISARKYRQRIDKTKEYLDLTQQTDLTWF